MMILLEDKGSRSKIPCANCSFSPEGMGFPRGLPSLGSFPLPLRRPVPPEGPAKKMCRLASSYQHLPKHAVPFLHSPLHVLPGFLFTVRRSVSYATVTEEGGLYKQTVFQTGPLKKNTGALMNSAHNTTVLSNVHKQPFRFSSVDPGGSQGKSCLLSASPPTCGGEGSGVKKYIFSPDIPVAHAAGPSRCSGSSM